MSWGGGVSNMWSSANDMYAHNDELTFSDKLTKIAGAHGLKFGGSARAAAEAAELPQRRGRLHGVLRSRLEPGHAGNAVGDILAGPSDADLFRARAPPSGEFRMWNFDFFAQDSWKLRPNLTLEFGVRGGYWTNNAELNGLGGYSIRRPTTRRRRSSSIRARSSS